MFWTKQPREIKETMPISCTTAKNLERRRQKTRQHKTAYSLISTQIDMQTAQWSAAAIHTPYSDLLPHHTFKIVSLPHTSLSNSCCLLQSATCVGPTYYFLQGRPCRGSDQTYYTLLHKTSDNWNHLMPFCFELYVLKQIHTTNQNVSSNWTRLKLHCTNANEQLLRLLQPYWIKIWFYAFYLMILIQYACFQRSLKVKHADCNATDHQTVTEKELSQKCSFDRPKIWRKLTLVLILMTYKKLNSQKCVAKMRANLLRW